MTSMKSISEALVDTLILTVLEHAMFVSFHTHAPYFASRQSVPITISYSHVGPCGTRAVSHAAASFLEGIAVRQSAHVSADVSVHYIGQRRAYQAKTCSLSGPSPFRPCPVPSAIVIHPVGSAS